MARVVEVAGPTDLMNLRLHRFGPADPTIALSRERMRRAIVTAGGPGVLQLDRTSDARYEARAWGPGAELLLERAEDVLGVHDGPPYFEGPLEKLRRKLSAFRLVQTPTVFEIFVIAVLQQRVSWKDAAWSFRQILRRHGERAPPPHDDLVLFPEPKLWRDLPQATYQSLGVDARRAQVLKRGASSWRRIEELREMSFEDADRRLRALPGVGPWTSQYTLGLALAHEDAVPLGDYDLPRLVSFALTGAAHADDRRMLEVLEPHRGRRFRVIRMLQESGIPTPRFGPRRGSGPGPGRLSGRGS